MRRLYRATRAAASSARLIAAGGLAGVVAVYVSGDYPQYQVLSISLIAIAIGAVIEYSYLSFEAGYDKPSSSGDSVRGFDGQSTDNSSIFEQVKADWSFLEMDKFLRKYSPLVGFILIFTLILSDLAFPYSIIIPWQLVALIGLLIAIPYLPLVKKLSYGGLTVDLSKEVEEASRDVEENLPIPQGIQASKYLPEEIPKQLYQLFEITHIAALAMLRIELESVLKEIAGSDEPMSFGYLLNDLQNQELFSRRTIHAIEEVRQLANQAIHEKDVRKEEAEEILEIGIEALERLYYFKEEGEKMDEK